MRLNTIVFETQNYYLYEGLTLTEQKSLRLWEHAGVLIKESNLTADQIQQIFSNIESGIKNNRTLIGQGKDAATAVNRAWEDLKNKVYNSGPMSNFASAYNKAAEKLKQATGGDQGVFKYVQQYRDFAEKHPIIQGFVYSVLIAAAGITGAGLGGATVLGLFKLTDQLLQGKDIRSAIYQGAKTGGLAYGASKLGDLIRGRDSTEKLTPAITGPGLTGNMTYDQAYNAFIQKFAQDPNNPSAMMIGQAKKFAATKAKEYAMSAGSVKESAELNKANIKILLSKVSSEHNKRIDEGVWDSIKGAAQKIGKNLTTKVTVDKLNSAWKKAGSPTDSEEIRKILQDAGVESTVIDKAFQDIGIQSSTTPGNTAPKTNNQTINTQEVVARIRKLTPAQQKEILALLGK